MDLAQRSGHGTIPRLSEATRQCAPVDDVNWRRITEAANAAYATSDLGRAFDLYRDALDEAERLFARASATGTSVPVPVIYNISCHNLAEIAERSGDGAAAEGFLVRAYDKLLSSAASPNTPLPLRLDCTRHLKQALALLIQHLHRRGVPDATIVNYVERAKSTAFAVFYAAKHADLARSNCDHCGVLSS